jgi:hypothetical protein
MVTGSTKASRTLPYATPFTNTDSIPNFGYSILPVRLRVPSMKNYT